MRTRVLYSGELESQHSRNTAEEDEESTQVKVPNKHTGKTKAVHSVWNEFVFT